MSKFTTAVAVALSLLGLAGCAAADNSAAPKKVEPKAQPGVVETTTTVTARPVFHVGDTVELPSGNQITVHALGDYVSGNQFEKPDPGNKFVALDAEGCAVKAAASLNPFQFELVMPDNTRQQISLMGSKEPGLHDTDLMVGDCVRGWVVFEVPAGQTPAAVAFTGSTGVRWLVG